MNILAIADKKPDKPIKELLASQPVDLVITLGDLEQSDISELGLVTHVPKIGVYGNHCFPGYMENLGIFDMHMRTWEFDGLTFGGFEGCVRYKKNPYTKMYEQEEAMALMEHFPYVDVFIAHAPPFGINDEEDPAHIGFRSFLTYLEEKRPKYFLHGHTYPAKEKLMSHYLDTKIFYIHGEQYLTLNS